MASIYPTGMPVSIAFRHLSGPRPQPWKMLMINLSEGRQIGRADDRTNFTCPKGCTQGHAGCSILIKNWMRIRSGDAGKDRLMPADLKKHIRPFHTR